MASPPEFVTSSKGVDAAGEFATFLDDARETAAHVLAELAAMQSCEPGETIPAAHGTATSVVRLYCVRVAEWCVFYTAASSRLPSNITVLHVARETDGGFAALETEAERRMR